MKNNKNWMKNCEDVPINSVKDCKTIEEAGNSKDRRDYLFYHKDCKALIGRINSLTNIDEGKGVCRHCKKPVTFKDINFVPMTKNKN